MTQRNSNQHGPSPTDVRIISRTRERLGRWIRWAGGLERATLLLLLVAMVAGLVFIRIADSISDGESHHFDPWLLRILRTADDPAVPIGPWWLTVMARDCTSLGGYFCLILFTGITAGYLYLDKKRHLSEFLLGSAVSGYLISTLLKAFFHRARPDIVPHLDVVTSSSFPSGHSMNSAVIYLTLGTLLAASVARRRLKIYVICVALLLTVLVGMSRIYLGVHYPSDVLAGWMAGLIWAIICFTIAKFLQRRGTVEAPVPIDDEPETTGPEGGGAAPPLQ